MSQENNVSNGQEQSGVNQPPKPFDPKDTARMQDLEARFNPESVVGHAVSGPETTDQFEGSKIFTFDKSGIPTRYALHRNEHGEIEGNSFRLQEKVRSASGENWVNSTHHIHVMDSNNPSNVDHRILATQRMTEQELKAVEKILGGKI